MRKLLRRLTFLINSRKAERDLREELELHQALKQERLEQSGMAADDARYASRRALGNTTRAVEDAREVWIWPSLDRLRQDVRYGVRMLRRQPMFAATAILTLALGIGATTAVFSVVEFELWKPLPFPQAHRLVQIYTIGEGTNPRRDPASAPELLDWRAQSNAFEDLAAMGNWTRRTLRGRQAAESVTLLEVTTNFFSLLGRSAALGRTFGPEDERSPNVLVLSDDFWRRSFGSDPNVIGRAVTIDETTYTIVGVAGADSLEFRESPDAFVAVPLASTQPRTERTLSVIGRMKGGLAIETAQADLRVVAQRMAAAYPTANQGRSVTLRDLREANTGFEWRQLFFFLGAAMFVLLLTCVNVANLLLARALRRDREFAVRRALGGGSAALARQLIVEGGLLAFTGGAAGLLLAIWILDIVPAWMPPDYLSRGTDIVLDYRVFLFALGVSALTSLLFGLAPAVLTSGRELNPLLVQGSRTLGGSPRQRRARHALVVAEMMIALVLLVGAGLFISSYARMLSAPLGFDPIDRVTMRVTLTGKQYADAHTAVPFAERLLDSVRAVPGVQNATVASNAPLGSGPIIQLARPGQESVRRADNRSLILAITPGYMRTLGVRQISGREFTDGDIAGAPRVAVINETLASEYFPGEDPVGRELILTTERRVRWAPPGTLLIVGVVSNVKNVGINEIGISNVYVPLAQHPLPTLQLIVHTSVPVANVIDPLRQAAAGVDKNLPVLGVRTMTQVVSESMRVDRFNLLMITTFGGLAMLMAAIGIYGTMSYSMEQRIQEFGVRLALGAQRIGVLRLAIGQAMRLGLIGTASGLALALIVARIIGDAIYTVPRQHTGLIFGVTTTDPLTLTSACVVLLLVTALAGIVPARRAMNVDPIIALRAD